MRIYLDTSALVKRYREEEGSELMNALFESDNELISSSWTLAEAIAAINKKVVKQQINTEERDFVIAVLCSSRR
ncbi:MAG: type II toxin-antitoxin system VapC family toxin [Methanomicrobia archaeon]|nr:type II toxin-antitoxin system VapC family toxin [Methanomicrobia archaeon]